MSEQPAGREWFELRVLVVNTHVGMLLTSAVPWLLRHRRYHAVLLQECSSPLARMRLRLVFNVLTWRLVGTRPTSTGRGSSGTIVATRRQRLRYVSSSNDLLTRQRFVDGVRDKWHPERRLTVGRYVDRRTHRDMTLIPAHPWHIRGGPEEVVREHNAQVRTYADAVEDAHRDGGLVIFGGDLNETRERAFALRELLAVDLRVVAWEHIDALFVTDREHAPVRVFSVENVPLTRFRGGEAHHKAISVVLLVQAMT